MLCSSRSLLGLTMALTAVFAGTAWWSGDLDRSNLVVDIPLVMANTLPVLAIGRNPLAVVILFGATYPVWVDPPLLSLGVPENDGHVMQSLPTLVALYAVGVWDRPLRLRLVALVPVAWMVGAAASGWWDVELLLIGYVAIVFVVVWALGVIIAERRSYAEELASKAGQLEQAQQELADRAVADERARIARELHDVIAHAMSVITVQAGVGAHLAASQPDQAAGALAVIERTGREALSEMRRLLTVLREAEPGGPRPAPQPGLDDLPQLVAAVSAAGSRVTVETEGEPRTLSPGLDLTAYRTIQEALTNVIKHVPGASALVSIRWQPNEVTIEITDKGGGASGQVTLGHGLRGMAERVALYDGELDAGADGDGFRVSARFPLEVVG
jgi:signal transduction histidine kinase